MPSLLGWPLIVYYLTLPRLNLSGWEVADVWLVLIGPLLPLPFQTFAFKIQFETWGSFLNQEPSFSLHINQLTSSCYYQLRQLRVVSRSLSCSSAAALVHAFVTSGLDHCSSILVSCLWLKLPVLIGFFAVPSHWVHTEIWFCFCLYALHATLVSNCSAHLNSEQVSKCFIASKIKQKYIICAVRNN